MFQAEIMPTLWAIRDMVSPPSLPTSDGTYDGVVFNLILELYDQTAPRHNSKVFAKLLFAGNTKVFECHSEAPIRRYVAPDLYSFVADHDECWYHATHSFLAEMYFDMAQKVNPHVPPAHLAHNSKIGGLWEPAWRLVKAKFKWVDAETVPLGRRLTLTELIPR